MSEANANNVTMFLSQISLQNFRNYSKAEFTFSKNTTLIVGPNTAGKTNLIEAIYLLASGKSFRADKDFQMVKFGEEIVRVKGIAGDIQLEVMITNPVLESLSVSKQMKKFLVNGVAKRRVDFVGNLLVVLFSPIDIDIIVDSPSIRRKFLDDILESVDREYRIALTEYTKGLRQRNALLENARQTGRRSIKQFEYWDNLLIKNGQIITQKREELIEFLNKERKDIFDFVVFYDKSIISQSRLLQYQTAEEGAGVTLIGPHRDDFSVSMFNNVRQVTHDVKFFGSRGQQRLVILQLKMLQLEFIEKTLGVRPALILDDIFSELDDEHIRLVLEMIGEQQTIVTTTHQEFVKNIAAKDVIELRL